MEGDEGVVFVAEGSRAVRIGVQMQTSPLPYAGRETRGNEEFDFGGRRPSLARMNHSD